MRRDAREEPEVEDVEAHDRAAAEPSHRPVRQRRLEGAALEPLEGTLEERERHARQEGAPRCAARQGVARRAHSRTDPMPGTKGGL